MSAAVGRRGVGSGRPAHWIIVVCRIRGQMAASDPSCDERGRWPPGVAAGRPTAAFIIAWVRSIGPMAASDQAMMSAAVGRRGLGCGRPTAGFIIAWAEAEGRWPRFANRTVGKRQRRRSPQRHLLIPDVTLVPGKPVTFEQLTVFVLERARPVMLGLVLDVGRREHPFRSLRSRRRRNRAANGSRGSARRRWS